MFIVARPYQRMHVEKVITHCECDCSTELMAIFIAQRYAIAVYAVVVCPSVRLSHVAIVPKRLNL